MILTFDHPALSTVCQPLTAEDDLSFISVMESLLRAEPTGVGLAASQIGVLKRAMLIRPTRKYIAIMLNPRIVWRSTHKEFGSEGCLSYPGVVASVERSVAVVVEYFDLSWQHRRDAFTKFAARVVQHEDDHLNGICRVGEAWRLRGR